MRPLFQTGWFVESLMTQTLIIHVIRTNKIPFIQSRASWPLTVTTLSIMALGVWLPFPACLFAGTHGPAATVLADPASDAARLCGPYASDQSMVAAEEVDLDAIPRHDTLRAAARNQFRFGRTGDRWIMLARSEIDNAGSGFTR